MAVAGDAGDAENLAAAQRSERSRKRDRAGAGAVAIPSSVQRGVAAARHRATAGGRGARRGASAVAEHQAQQRRLAASRAGTAPTMRPCRITTMRSAQAITSRSLWVMNTTP